MKVFGKIVIITVLCFCILGFKSEVYADDELSDEIGYSYYYNASFDVEYSKYTNTNTYQMNVQLSPDVQLACYWYDLTASSAKELRILVIYPDGTVYEGLTYALGSIVYSSDTSKYVLSGSSTLSVLTQYNDGSSVSSVYENKSPTIRNSDNQPVVPEDLFFTTNIPIFIDYSSAKGYLEGTVSISQAENYEDCINISYDSTDIPIPHNLKVTEENSKYFISWSQTAEELPFITEVSYRRHIDALQITHDVEGAYPTYPNKPELFYNPLLLHKYDITDEILNIVKFYREKCGVDSFKCSYVIRIRNKYVKSESEIVYSNVVRAVLTISYDVNTGIKINAEYEEKNENGDFVPDSSYNDYGDGSGMIRDDIGAASGSSVSVGNFISNIVNGFGLLGDNGVISMMSSVFPFLPAELWALIYMMVSLFLIVALFKLVVK